MKEAWTPAEVAALKKEISASLHCALPGIVESFDPAVQTAAVRPAVKRQDIPFPLVRDVPVFFPGGREQALTFPVSPGDECLLVFADSDMDRWFETGRAEEPASARNHDLPDAFAFVGFRSRPHALPDFPGEARPFPHDHDGRYYTETETDALLAGKAEAEHTHEAGEIVSGTLPLARGGTGQASCSASTIPANVAEAAAGCSITTAQYTWWGKLAMLRLVVKKTAAVASGTTTLCTLVTGRRPRYTASAQWGWDKSAQILPSGEVRVNGAISANESLTILSTYVVA